MTKDEFDILSQIMVAFNRDKVAQVWPFEMISEKTGCSPGWFITAMLPFARYAAVAGWSLEDCLICVTVIGQAEIGAKKAGWAMREITMQIFGDNGPASKYRHFDGGLLALVETLRADHTGPDWLGEYFGLSATAPALTVLFNSPEFDRWKGVFNAG